MPRLHNKGTSSIPMGSFGILDPDETQDTPCYWTHPDVEVISEAPYATPILKFARFVATAVDDTLDVTIPVPDRRDTAGVPSFPYKLSVLCEKGSVEMRFNTVDVPADSVVVMSVGEIYNDDHADHLYVRKILFKALTSDARVKVICEKVRG